LACIIFTLKFFQQFNTPIVYEFPSLLLIIWTSAGAIQFLITCGIPQHMSFYFGSELF